MKKVIVSWSLFACLVVSIILFDENKYFWLAFILLAVVFDYFFKRVTALGVKKNRVTECVYGQKR